LKGNFAENIEDSNIDGFVIRVTCFSEMVSIGLLSKNECYSLLKMVIGGE
jgi:hypothetical protein